MHSIQSLLNHRLSKSISKDVGSTYEEQGSILLDFSSEQPHYSKAKIYKLNFDGMLLIIFIFMSRRTAQIRPFSVNRLFRD